MKRKIFAAALCALLLLTTVFSTAAVEIVPTEHNVHSLAQEIFSSVMAQAGAQDAQAWLDGALCERAGIDAEWYVIALSRYDEELDFSRYAAALERYLEQNRIGSASTRQKYALALIAVGRENTAFVRDTVNASIGEQGIMSLVFGLHLLHNGLTSERVTVDALIGDILTMQLADGGFAVTGTQANADVTAMTLQALAPYCERAEVAAAVEQALNCLSALQRADASFESYGDSNAESCAQVLMALCALDVDVHEDPRFLKNDRSVLDALLDFRTTRGDYSHLSGGESNVSATAQALMAYVSLDSGRLCYVFDDVHYDPAGIVDTPDVVFPSEHSGADYRLWVSIALGAVAVAGALVLMLKGRRSDALVLLLACAVLTAAVWLLRVRSVRDYYGDTALDGPVIGTVALQVRCDVLDEKARPVGGEDGVLLAAAVEFAEGETVYDALLRAAAKQSVLVQNGGAGYVVGIGELYEFDFGAMSGWVYTVNGVRPAVSSEQYVLRDGDNVIWHYTCAMGEDIATSQEVLP